MTQYQILNPLNPKGRKIGRAENVQIPERPVYRPEIM